MFGSSSVPQGTRIALTALLVCLLVGPVPSGAKPELDNQRMQRDIRIMEDVLGHLYEDAGCCMRGPWSRGPDVRGVYVEGYGVVLAVEGGYLSGPRRVRMEFARQVAGEPGGRPRVVTGECPSAASCSHPDSVAAHAREVLVEFFATYADALGQLGGKDRITVAVTGGDRGLGPSLGGAPRLVRKIMRGGAAPDPQADTLVVGDLVMCDVDSLVESAGLNLEEFQHQLHTGGTKGPLIVRLATEGRAGTGCPPEGGSVQAMALRSGGRCRVALVATGLKDDVSAFHRGRIDAEELARRLEFVEGPLEPGDEKRLDIMAGILEEGLSRGTGVQAQGMYVKGLGALFFVDAGPAELGVQLIPKDLFLSQLGRRDRGDEQLVPEMTTGTGGGERGKQIEDREAQLVELVAEYGSSLRMLKADESVVVVVGPSRGPFGGSRASGLVLRARHRDISAFDRGRLDLDGFRQKVEVSER